ncbi:NUMOD4 domain-containing protein [Faecalicatena contorta]|uniref:NUMOD4 motif-containing protein n=1 Tax=Faecalicatena contorta TaxID=39482 RepID=A0A315ZUH3_9FIRM|nr:NUMOD4 domain-containing protein [Faecalicatena contorta]PWJ49145.1 NUMOD4 motif-containing protein [Faecalicatena contorta]SUQ14850.1 NUMOD4 motif-containing protein [Faecalicatena contorta]
MEIWRDIHGYEGVYQVGNLGRVKCFERIDKRNHIRPGILLKIKTKRMDI